MFKNMKIGVRLIMSLSIMIVLMIAIITVGISSINKINENLYREVKIDDVRRELANSMVDNVREVSIALRAMLLEKGNYSIEEQKKKISDFRNAYDSDILKYEELVPEGQNIIHVHLSKVKALQDEARALNNLVIESANEGSTAAEVSEMLKTSTPKVNEWLASVNYLIKLEKENSVRNYDHSISLFEKTRLNMLILGVTAFLLAALIALILTLSITKPLQVATTLVTSRELSVDVSAYMKGNSELDLMIQSFSKEISERKRQEDELKVYRDQLEEMVNQRTADLSNVILEVKETVNILVSTSSQILAATIQVASGTAETATAITETSTTVEEVQQATKQSAQKAKNVAENAELVAKVSNEGQKAVEETVKGIGRIREQMDLIAQTVIRLSEQSQSIGGIIASVTDIADQSNLLAVNAAIEAAKAGENGRGFAVVAQEIKNLAGQSKQATLQVRNILFDIQKATGAAVMATEQGSKAVEAGVIQSAQAGEAIRILAKSSNEAVSAATQIVASSQQQVVGMEQIGVAMQNIKQAGTETALSMGQSEKSAKNLNELGQKLKDMVERFGA
jgi:methyl-accepting chemotaxis protein